MSSSGRSSRPRKRQVRLQFLPLPSSSPAKDIYSTSIQDRLANVRYEGARSTLLTSSQNVADLNDTPLSTPVPSSLPLNKSPSAISSPLARLNKSTEASTKEEDSTNTRAGTPDEDEVVFPSSKKRRVQISQSSDEGEADTTTRRLTRYRQARGNVETPVRSRTIASRLTPRLSSRVKAVQDLGSAESSEDDAEVMLTQSARTARSLPRPRPQAKPSTTQQNDFIVDDDEVEYMSSDMPPPRKRVERTRQRVRRSRAEQDEIEDDLVDLQDSDGEHEIEDRRTRGGPVQTQRDRTRAHLEALKRRRAGEKTRKVIDTDEDDELVQDAAGSGYVQDDGADIDQIGIDKCGLPEIETFDHENDEVVRDGEASAQPFDDSLRFGEEEGDDGFVVSDDDPADGVDSERGMRSGIPLAFTSFASRRPRELFVYVVEWLVKNKIAPAFTRDDEIYLLSWNKINDQLKAQAGSRLISAAWSEDFKNTILARPHMEFHHAGQDCEHLNLNCDACKRTNHPAVYRFTFSGHAYHKDTLEPVDEDIEDPNHEGNSIGPARDEDSEHASYDEAGHSLPSSRTVFNLGRFCAANAEMGHKLTHWKYNLNACLFNYLEEQGVLSAKAIVTRDKLSKKKREKEADNIVDLMEETGVINEMWSSLQGDLENARHGMEDHRSEHQGGQPIRRGRAEHKGGLNGAWLNTGQTRIMVESDSE